MGLFTSLAQAADCSRYSSVTDGVTVLAKALWDGEFNNAITCINARLEKSGGTMTGNLNFNSGADTNWYSDAGSTLKASVDGATGNIATAGDFSLAGTKRFYLDGGTDTYFTEALNNDLRFVVGNVIAFRVTSTSAEVGSGADFFIQTNQKLSLDGNNSAYIKAPSNHNMSFYANGSERFRINSSGNVFVTNGDFTVSSGQVYAPNIAQYDNSNDIAMYFDTSTGQITHGPSSRKYKENIKDLNEEEDLSSEIYKLRPVTYYYKNADPLTRKKDIGLIAEEVEEVMPEMVAYNADHEPEGVAYQNLPILLLAEIKKLKNQIDELQNEVQTLRESGQHSSPASQEENSSTSGSSSE